MSHAQVGSVVVVSLVDGGIQDYPWATSVRVDRKATLHIYGPNRQHIVHLAGEWKQYAASAPDPAETAEPDPEEYH